jgi:hypothetical protein
MDIDFRKLLEAPKLRALFLEDSGLEERELVELLETDPKEAWGMINPEVVLQVYYQSISGGSFGVYEWGGLYFAINLEADLVDGPFDAPEDAAAVISNMSISDFCETDHIEYSVFSKLDEGLSLKITEKLVRVGEQITMNWVTYRREPEGYVRA